MWSAPNTAPAILYQAKKSIIRLRAFSLRAGIARIKRRISLHHELRKSVPKNTISKARHMSDPENPIVLIPARMAATRLPGKPLADICGVPMIVRVVRQAELAGIGPVVVAAGDEEIVQAVLESE